MVVLLCVLTITTKIQQGDKDLDTALHAAVEKRNVDIVKLLVKADPTDTHIQNNQAPSLDGPDGRTALRINSVDQVKRRGGKLYKIMNRDALLTALHAVIKNLDEAKNEVRDVIKMIIDVYKCALISSNGDLNKYPMHRLFADKIFSQTDEHGQTILELAVERNYVEVVELILNVRYQIYGDDSIGDDFISLMPLIYKAKDKGYKNIAKLLTERYDTGAEFSTDLKNQASFISAIRRCQTELASSLLDNHAKDLSTGQVTEGASDVIKMMVNAAKRWSGADFESLFNSKDELGSTVLQLAIERNFVEAVELILLEDPAYQHDRDREIKRSDLLHFIFKAIDNKLSADIIKLLSQTYEAGIINPDHKHVLALILAIKRRDEGSVLRSGAH
ncbi:hypothetical protein POM88_020670 [Heracleum sosnowskyi]|uniref:Uncharacterized protein n=1 Tax=Heracleum sosnowskyi TaxID=360622 RepID=A0AAD8MNB4_9APIA|nr:hypothetical protein POM88_020670 [Heracleum sosnowskyi]